MTSIDDCLIEACWNGNMDLVESLIKKGARINCVEEEWGYTPVDRAIAGHHFNIAEWLINHGADVNVKTRNGNSTPIKDLCNRYGADAWDGRKVAEMVIEKLNDKESRLSEILLDVAINREICEWIISKGADVNAVDKYSRTPLMMAACNGKRQIVELLLNNGADADAKDNQGKTAMKYARENGFTEIEEIIKLKRATLATKISRFFRH